MTTKRPKRLWAICGLNIFTATASLLAVVFLVVSPSAPEDLALDGQAIAATVSLATFLIVASVLAFFRIRHGRWLAFLAAILFYGVLVLQQTVLLAQMADTITEQERLGVVASTTRSALTILLNAWALFSAKTSQYFADVGVVPQVTPADDA